MPRYPHLLTSDYDTSLIGSKMRALRTVGVPYTDGEIDTAPAAMDAQAKTIAAEVEAQKGPTGLADKEIVALTAYLQRLGTDIKWKRPVGAAAVGRDRDPGTRRPRRPSPGPLRGARGPGASRRRRRAAPAVGGAQ